MIKQLVSKDVEDYIKNNPKSVLLDVRTEEEWNTDGKPDGEKMGLKTHFLTKWEDEKRRRPEILIPIAAARSEGLRKSWFL